ncbi:MAG: tetratricopeptide repeat protein [Candidatus Omnitrophica bacterium]|nr:tetratricopeptide repeat protein [Candidatus Omnitrophota bacterium]
MQKIDLEKERRILDREITFFHFERAKRKIAKCIKESAAVNDIFFLSYFTAQKFIIRRDYEKAIKYLNICIKLRLDDGCSYNDKALCFAEFGKYEQAMAIFDRGIALSRDCACLYHNKGWLLNKLGKFKQSIIYFQKALELEGSRVEATFSLGDSYLKMGDTHKAKKYFILALPEIKGKSSYVYKEIRKHLDRLQKK